MIHIIAIFFLSLAGGMQATEEVGVCEQGASPSSTDEMALLQHRQHRSVQASMQPSYLATLQAPYTCEQTVGSCWIFGCDTFRHATCEHHKCTCNPQTECGFNGSTTCLPKKCLGPDGPQPLCGQRWADVHREKFNSDWHAPAQCCQCMQSNPFDVFEKGTVICDFCMNALNVTVPGKPACASNGYPGNKTSNLFLPYAKKSVLHEISGKWRGWFYLESKACAKFLNVSDKVFDKLAEHLPKKLFEKDKLGHWKIIGKDLSKGMCALDDTAVVAACEVIGVGPEDPLSEICAASLGTIFWFACDYAVSKGTDLTACAIADGFGCSFDDC